jgi:hypothetical protein
VFSSLSKHATALALDSSEVALLLFGLLLVVGLVGEYSESERWKKYVKTFEMLVILGVAGELFADAGVFVFSARLQSLSDIEVGRLNVAAESANATAKQFESQIADANSKADTARRDAESFRLDIAKANERAANAEEATVTLSKATEDERAARLKIDQTLADRVCGNAQSEVIAANTKPFAGQEFQLTTYWESKEPMAVSNCIYGALLGAGWKFIPYEHGSALLGGIIGVLVYVHPEAAQQTKNAANTLVSVLVKEGIQSELRQQNDPSHPNNTIILSIGTKR